MYLYVWEGGLFVCVDMIELNGVGIQEKVFVNGGEEKQDGKKKKINS